MSARLLCLGTAWFATAATLWSQPILMYKMMPGESFGYKVKAVESSYPGDGPTAARSSTTEMPFLYKVLPSRGGNSLLEVTQGPLIVKGRSVGRARRTTEEVGKAGNAKDQVPGSFFVCLPKGGVLGAGTWKANFSAGPPLPAGMQASYTYKGLKGEGKYALITFTVDHFGASKVKGKGELLLRLSDGLLESGTATLNVLHVRPDPNDRSKMRVNERVEFKYTISRLN